MDERLGIRRGVEKAGHAAGSRWSLLELLVLDVKEGLEIGGSVRRVVKDGSWTGTEAANSRSTIDARKETRRSARWKKQAYPSLWSTISTTIPVLARSRPIYEQPSRQKRSSTRISYTSNSLESR
jgi:hypothetical protein